MKITFKAKSYLVVASLAFTLFAFFSAAPVHGQTEVDERAVISFDKGLGFFDPDSLFGVNLRFRMQNRLGINTVSHNDFSIHNIEASVRRLRLRFDGFLGQNNFTYYLQLSFSRGDQDWDNTGFPGIVRDAMVFYNFTPDFYIGFGQGKLPGNRQRVTSSGSQQFADRSTVNALFNIDRDFGLMAYYQSQLSGLYYNLKGAISTGEGRNISRTDDGLAYTGRIELLPLGLFKSDGDFFEGDLFREPTPKVSIGATASYNHKARRASGQRGVEMPVSQDIRSYFADLIAKYNGWAVAMEYASRQVNDQQIFMDEGLPLYSLTGWGFNGQFSYVFPSLYEIAARYTFVQPDDLIRNHVNKQEIYTLGMSRYFRDHRNKIQLNISYHQNPGEILAGPQQKFWNVMIQVETGI